MTEKKTGLRVAFISTYPPDRGNLAEYGSHLTQALANIPSIEHVHVLANGAPSTPNVESLSPKMTVHRVWRSNDSLSIQSLAYHARKLKPDIVHLNAGIRTWGKGRVASMSGAALAQTLRTFGLKVLTTMHTIGDTVQLETMKIDFLTRAGMALATSLYLRADAISVTMPSMKRALVENYKGTNVVHVAHGTYGPKVETMVVPAKASILAFGFWGALKNPDLVVDAVRAVREKGLDVELVLGGGAHPYFPEYYENVKAKYAKLPFVRFTGYVAEQKMEAMFNEASVVVMPYNTNAGASGVLNLVRSHGRPVIISNEPALIEQINMEGGAAWVYNGVGGLIHALEKVLSSPKAQQELGTANLEVSRRVTLVTQAHRFAKIYENILNGEVPEDEHQTSIEDGQRLNLADGEAKLLWPRRLREVSAA